MAGLSPPAARCNRSNSTSEIRTGVSLGGIPRQLTSTGEPVAALAAFFNHAAGWPWYMTVQPSLAARSSISRMLAMFTFRFLLSRLWQPHSVNNRNGGLAVARLAGRQLNSCIYPCVEFIAQQLSQALGLRRI